MKAGDFGDMWENLEGAAVFLQIYDRKLSEHPETDLVPLLQMAWALYSDKPIIIVVKGDDRVPEHLRRAADEVVRIQGDLDAADQVLVEAALRRQLPPEAFGEPDVAK